MKQEIRLTIEILRLQEILQGAIHHEQPQHIIKFYKGMIENKTVELELLQTVEHV